MAELFVQLKTEFDAPREVSHVEVSLARDDKPWKRPQFVTNSAPDELGSDTFVPVADFRNFRSNRLHRVYVRLLDRRGASIAFRTHLLTIRLSLFDLLVPERRRHRLLVVIDRS